MQTAIGIVGLAVTASGLVQVARIKRFNPDPNPIAVMNTMLASVFGFAIGVAAFIS